MLDMFINFHQTYSWLGLREVQDVINHWHLLAYPLIDIEFHTDKLSSQRCIRAAAMTGLAFFSFNIKTQEPCFQSRTQTVFHTSIDGISSCQR